MPSKIAATAFYVESLENLDRVRSCPGSPPGSDFSPFAPQLRADRTERYHARRAPALGRSRLPAECVGDARTHTTVLDADSAGHGILVWLSASMDLLRGIAAPRRSQPVCRGHHPVSPHRPHDGGAGDATSRATG